MSFDNISTELLLYVMLYSASAMVSLIACIYLLFRKNNAFQHDVTPPMPLRHWAGALCAVTFLSHIWWLLFYIFSGDTTSVGCMIIAFLDCVALMTTIPGTMFAMLQDRKRHIWPIVIGAIPFAAFEVMYIANSDKHYLIYAMAYFLLIFVIFTIYIWYLPLSNTGGGCVTIMPIWKIKRSG